MSKDNPFLDPKPQKRYGVLLSGTPEQYEMITAMAEDLGVSRSTLLKLALADFTDKWLKQKKAEEEKD